MLMTYREQYLSVVECHEPAVTPLGALTNLTRPSLAGGGVVMRLSETLAKFLELGLTRYFMTLLTAECCLT